MEKQQKVQTDEHRAKEIMWAIFRTWAYRWQKQMSGEARGKLKEDPTWWTLESKRAMGQVVRRSELSIRDLETFRDILLGNAPEIDLGARLPEIAWEVAVWTIALKGKGYVREIEKKNEGDSAARRASDSIAHIMCCTKEEYVETVRLMISTARERLK